MSDTAAFDTLNPALRDDPYPDYAAVRELAPIFWSHVENAWVLTRYQEVAEAYANAQLRNGELGRAVERITRTLGDDLGDLLRLLEMALFFRNPPTHDPLRGFMARLLAARPQSACVAVVEDIAARLIAPLARDGGMDLVRGFAEPLPPRFMGWLYGLGEEDSRWLAGILEGVPSVLDRGRPVRVYRALDGRLAEAHGFLRECLARRRREPGDDALSVMVRLNAESDAPLDDQRLAAAASFLFLAGFETTAALIGNGLWLLLGHPHEFDRLRGSPDLIPSAVEEALRLEPPIQQTPRHAAQRQVIAGQQVQAGQRILLLIAAANRDPRAYPEPERFQPGRGGPSVLSLGGGAHACLGAGIARMEARIAFKEVLRGRRPRITIEAPEWWPNQNQRRLKSLPVEAS